MTISFSCPSCHKVLKAKDHSAGRSASCPGCGQVVVVPTPEEEAGDFLLHEEGTAPAEVKPENKLERLLTDLEHGQKAPRKKAQAEMPSPPAPKPVSLPPPATEGTPFWLRHLHWLLMLALIPLGFTLVFQGDEKEDQENRLEKTLREAPPEARGRILVALEDMEEGKGSPEEFFAALPGGKMAGALLPRKTFLHWAFAAVAALIYLGFLLVLASDGAAEPRHLLYNALFTATLGILFLFLVQLLAEWSQGVWLVGRSIWIIVFFLVKLIGFSYRAALDPENGFVLSFVGFTLGVGLCEEVCKALPLLWRYRQPNEQSWRGAFLWGLASGAGFGIAEGITYCGDFYNGISGPGTYLVRFISCVALHALWTGSVGITIHQRQDLLQQEIHWLEYFPRLVLLVGIPMVLHGLYDTFLKKELNGMALGVALLSFVFLAFQISRLHGVDDKEAAKEFLRAYERRRTGLS